MIDYLVGVKERLPSYFVTIIEVETNYVSRIELDVGPLMEADQQYLDIVEYCKDEIADILIQRIEDRFEGKAYYETGMTIAVHAACWDDPSISFDFDDTSEEPEQANDPNNQ